MLAEQTDHSESKFGMFTTTDAATIIKLTKETYMPVLSRRHGGILPTVTELS